MQWVRKFFTRLSVPCIMVGLILFAASLAPSLIPRGPVLQGVLGGVLTAIGYLTGSVVGLIWLAADMPRITGRVANALSLSLTGLACALMAWIATWSLEWQNELRAKMGMEPLEAQRLLLMLLVASGVFAVACLIGSLVAALFHFVRSRFYRIMPVRRANVLGLITVSLVFFNPRWHSGPSGGCIGRKL